ncbi:hypothetical protein CEB3_c02920 [Peptococcaceae bacterium CEB3]|nr:hypothetical protein CEB3_c02920 [Peptococcaceae bacterium CEB3]
MRKGFIPIVIGIIFMLTGCGPLQTVSLDGSQSAKTKSINVTMDVKPVISNGKVQCNITTNLPEKARLNVILDDGQLNQVNSSSVSVVKGRAMTTFSSVKPGDYTIDVETDIAQPSSVTSLIGDSGQNLVGRSIETDKRTNGKRVFVEKQITIGTHQQIEAQLKKEAEIKAKAAAEAEAKAKAQAEAEAKAKAQAAAKAKALAKTRGVRIGMTEQQVLDSMWGKPEEVNRTISQYGTDEQWVYGGNNYLYFENGILTSIQN